jgi:hypothetical protein
MSTLRKTFRVVIDGGEPIDVTTSARDLIVAEDLAERDERLAGFALVHHALRRQGVDVPDLETFIDTLDEFQALDEPNPNGTADDLDPTSATGSATGP